MKVNISDLADNITTRKEFESFLEELIEDYKKNHETWDNNTIADLLEGLYGFTLGLSGYYKNQKIEIDIDKPSWSVFANILLGAKVHE